MMVTVSIGKYGQAQGTLVRREGDMAHVNAGGQLVYGKLITPTPAPLSEAQK
jgi:hypothetical protein